MLRCAIADTGDPTTESSTDQLSADPEYVELMDDPKPSCSAISYFDQSFERIEGGETSTAIWRTYVELAHEFITVYFISRLPAECSDIIHIEDEACTVHIRLIDEFYYAGLWGRP